MPEICKIILHRYKAKNNLIVTPCNKEYNLMYKKTKL